MNPSLKNTLTSSQGDRRIGPNADIDKPIMGLYINTMNNIECIMLNFHIHPYIVIYHADNYKLTLWEMVARQFSWVISHAMIPPIYHILASPDQRVQEVLQVAVVSCVQGRLHQLDEEHHHHGGALWEGKNEVGEKIQKVKFNKWLKIDVLTWHWNVVSQICKLEKFLPN